MNHGVTAVCEQAVKGWRPHSDCCGFGSDGTGCACDCHRMRALVTDLTAMLQSAATWPKDDIQGMRYHALEAAKRGRAALGLAPSSDARLTDSESGKADGSATNQSSSDLAAALRAVPVQPQQDWQPIETLNDVDLVVLLFAPPQRLWEEQHRGKPWFKPEMHISTRRNWTWATHWMPLPAAPRGEEDKK